MSCLSIFTTVSLVLFGVVPAASAQATFQNQCVFKNVVAFGASVTQAIPAIIPGYGAAVGAIETYGQYHGDRLPPASRLPLQTKSARPYGLSPVRYLVKGALGKAGLKNITYIGSAFTNAVDDLGTSQIDSLLNGKRRPLFEKASLLVGVDAFYWDAVWNTCGQPNGPEVKIRELVETVKSRGQTLVLGNVPLENEANVRISSRRVGISGLWYAPSFACAESINASLAARCVPENNCYLLDMKAAIDDLNCGVKLKLANGNAYGYFELRPDGVHMSDVGSRLIAERIAQAFAAHPPTCGD